MRRDARIGGLSFWADKMAQGKERGCTVMQRAGVHRGKQGLEYFEACRGVTLGSLMPAVNITAGYGVPLA